MAISAFFTNLRVRTKLTLFMLVPLATMLALTGIEINQKHAEKKTALVLSESWAIAFTLADFVHELQQERGLSAGYIGSKGKQFSAALQSQRQKTQQVLEALKIQFRTYNFPKYRDTKDLFKLLQIEIDNLPAIRQQIDKIDNGEHFNFYTYISHLAIDITYHLHVTDQGANLTRLNNSYNHLLHLQESLGLERGALNRVFTQHQFTHREFMEISAYIALQNSAIDHYTSVAKQSHLAFFQKNINQPVVTETQKMRASAFNKSERNELLNELHALIGYGGLIHDFKNYVIRGKSFYPKRFASMIIKVNQLLSRFRKLKGLGKNELAHIDAIETTFEQYQKLFKHIGEMHEAGATVIDIDKVVKVDDRPALLAIKALRSDITTYDTSAWWPKMTRRIEFIKEVRNLTQKEITQVVQQKLADAQQGFIFYLVLMFSVLTITLLIGYLLVRRLANETSNIASAMNNMRASGNFDQLIKTDGHDEISEIVTAFNQLLTMRNKTEEDHIKLQEQLLESQKQRALLTFSGGVAHNFNNKLATILGYTALAMNQKDVKDSEETQRYLTQIKESSEDSIELVKNILTYSQSSFMEKTSSVSIEQLTRELIEQQKQKMPTTINLTHDIEEDLPNLYFDPQEFKRMFDALCLNAAEAINDSGSIEILLQRTTLTEETCSTTGKPLNGKFIELSIKDNGKGIQEEHIKRIFEPFFTTKDLSEGAGLGLAVVLGVINKNNGHIIVESTPGKGTTFRVMLPTTDRRK